MIKIARGNSMATELGLRDGLYGALVREFDNRRVPQEERKTYNVKQFWQRHHEIVNLSSQGFKNVEIAKILGITPETVSNTLNSEIGEEKLAEMRLLRDGDAKATIERIRVLRDQALKVYQEVLEGQDENGNPVECTPSQRLHVADVVTLELAGMKAPTKIQSSSVSTILSGEELLEIKRRALAEAKSSGLIIDIEAKEAQNVLSS